MLDPSHLLVWTVAVLAFLPACLFLWNLTFYLPPPAPKSRRSVSILIPARNEQRSIARSVTRALASENVDIEVIVLDDHSDDDTYAVVQSLARSDARLRLYSAPPLPPGWCGKQFACSVLAGYATCPVLCFIDADVELQPTGVARMVEALNRGESSLLSGFPEQVTGTFLEKLVLPLMHFLLLGFLPMAGMRKLVSPSFGAGCGQIFVADRDAYVKCGGHSAIKNSRHDGLTLPKVFRRAGFMTDLCDATNVSSCRMYTSAREVFWGLLKNAGEGLAAPGRIVPFSVLLLAGQVLPVLLCVVLWRHHAPASLRLVMGLAVACTYLPRLMSAVRFRQSYFAALLHPVAILALLSIQWIALVRSFLRIPSIWKGRTYSTT